MPLLALRKKLKNGKGAAMDWRHAPNGRGERMGWSLILCYFPMESDG
jgi:hypothetical protein